MEEMEETTVVIMQHTIKPNLHVPYPSISSLLLLTFIDPSWLPAMKKPGSGSACKHVMKEFC